VAECQVDADQGLFLLLVQVRIGQDLTGQIRCTRRRVEDARLHVQRLRGDAQGPRDLLQDGGGGAPQASLDLAEVRIGYAGELGESPQGEAGCVPLLTDEAAELAPTVARVAPHRR
jgi:hypothetical protein